MLLRKCKMHRSVLIFSISTLLLAVTACTTPPSPDVTSVTIASGDREVGVTETVELTAEVIVQGKADNSVTWTSSAESIARINQEGELKALAIGTSTITANSVFRAGKSDSIEITVTATCRSPERVIVIPDLNLQAAILETLESPDGLILCARMHEMNLLTAREKEIQNLQGLQHAANLTNLDLGKNDIGDITPLADLTNLENLNLASNDISDITPLENLTALTNLYLGNASITDITPLENLTNLKYLYLGWNNISGITPLKTLTNLKDLDLSDNDVRDIEPLENHTNLRNVYLENNCLDVADNSPARSVIATLEVGGAHVHYDPQRNCGP